VDSAGSPILRGDLVTHQEYGADTFRVLEVKRNAVTAQHLLTGGTHYLDPDRCTVARQESAPVDSRGARLSPGMHVTNCYYPGYEFEIVGVSDDGEMVECRCTREAPIRKNNSMGYGDVVFLNPCHLTRALDNDCKTVNEEREAEGRKDDSG